MVWPPPTEEKLAHPPLLRQFPFSWAIRRAPGDLRATAEQQQAYRRTVRIGDPPADAVVEMIRRLPAGEGRRLFELALQQGIDAVDDPPPELIDFFRHVERPCWVDDDQLELACRVIARTGAIGSTALATALMGGYLASRVTKALVRTGELERMAPRRLAETLTWWLDVTTPGGLQQRAPGFTSTLRVRLMHAQVRAGLRRTPGWDARAWDDPLNTSQMAGTLMLFGLVHLRGSQALGVRINAEERAAVYALWRYVGMLLGIDAHILPTSERDHWRLAWLEADLEFRNPDQDSIRLAQALIHAIGPMVTGEATTALQRAQQSAVTGLMCAAARLLLGTQNADYLEIPDQKILQALVVAGAAATRILEFARPLIPGATRLCEILGRRTQRAWTQQAMTAYRGDRSYGRHDHLTHHIVTGHSTKTDPRRRSSH